MTMKLVKCSHSNNCGVTERNYYELRETSHGNTLKKLFDCIN